MKKNYLLSITFLLILAPVIALSQNQFWALTNAGGAYSQGALVHSGSNASGLTVAHSFQSPAGWSPYGDVLQASDGNLYGTCYEGGSFSSCTIFRFNPFTNTYTDVYDFDIIHGDYPRSGVIEGPNGKLYGAAYTGGVTGEGVLYSYDMQTATYTDMYDFSYPGGAYPTGSPVLHSNGKLYGLASAGGGNSVGALYSYDITTATYTAVASFTGTLNGAVPYGSLIELSNGKLYGMASSGGLNNKGTIFSFDPATSTLTTLHSFNDADGAAPCGNLTLAANGFLYGMTKEGGINGAGVIFKLDASNNTYIKLHDFVYATGSLPAGSLLEENGVLMGTASDGGLSGKGVIFNYSLVTNTYTKVLDFNGTNGERPTGSFIKYITTGINQNFSDNENLSVFPNPVSDQLHISWKENLPQNTHLTLYDLSGKSINFSSKDFSENLKTINFKGMNSGTYFLEINTDKQKIIRKIIKD